MNQKDFENVLESVIEMGKVQGMVVQSAQLREAFRGEEPDTEQMLLLLRRLKEAGIRIETIVMPEPDHSQRDSQEEQTAYEEGQAPEARYSLRDVTVGTAVPLTYEEKEWLDEYLGAFGESYDSYGEALSVTEQGGLGSLTEWERSGEAGNAFLAAGNGDAGAREEILGRMLPWSIRTAAEWNCAEIALADLVQEANMALVAGAGDPACRSVEWLKDQVIQGIRGAILAQEKVGESDRALVERVEKFEEVVRELNDGEGEKFTIAELAVILDMTVDEIRGILRLTGDDDGGGE